MPKIAAMVSGTGSILEAMLAHGLNIDMVIADRCCPAFRIAEKSGISIFWRDRTFGPSFDERAQDDFSLYISELLESYKEEDVVAMAGFKTILRPVFFTHYAGIILNTHPSLLPAFKGNRAVRQALDAGVEKTGCTIHIATACMDAGPILAQQEVPVLPGDSEITLHSRIKEVEKILYPQVIAEILSGNRTIPCPL